jgi:hypothetical protein
MKRANETSSTSSHASAFINVESSGRTSQPDARSTTSDGTNTAVQPFVTSTSNRTGTAILPATPSAIALGTSAGDQGNRDVFADATLVREVQNKVSKGHFAWKDAELLLTAQQRKDFLIVSLHEIEAQRGADGRWSGITDMIMDAIGMDSMLAQKWPLNKSLVRILAGLKNHTWLDMALSAQSGPHALQIHDALGRTPLQIAVGHGIKKVVRAILAFDDEAGSLRLRKTAKKNHIPLHIACAHGHDSVVALLLKMKGKEQCLTADKYNLLPIHAAVTSGTGAGVLPHLLAECAAEQVYALTSSGKNAMMLAAITQSPKAVKMLLDVPGTLAGQLEARDENGCNAIDHARDTGNADVIALLEAAMRGLPAGPSSTAGTTSASTTPATYLQPAVGIEPPVPLTPNPPTPAPAVQPNFSDTEEDSSSL